MNFDEFTEFGEFMAKSKKRGITYLASDTSPVIVMVIVIVMESIFSLSPLGRYLFPMSTMHR